MKNILIKLLIFFASSFLVLTLVYYHIKIVNLQQIILLLLVVLLISLRVLRNPFGKKIARDWLLVFIVTFFIQVLITSSGAVFSPFFVLIHLYVIGLSLFFDFWTAFFFLILEMAVLALNIVLDQNLYYLVKQDFGSVLLYFSSILVITPVSKFISQQYHVKTDTLKTLFKQLNTQESIIEQIGDFVFTTDRDLIVLSANDSAKKIADLSKDNSALTDLIELVDEKGNRLSKDSLLSSLTSLTQNKPSLYTNNLNLTIKGYTLKLSDRKTFEKVTMRVNPVSSPDGSVEKFIFLIGQTGEKESGNTESKLEEAHRKYISILDILRKDPIISKLITISLYLEILKKYEQDILLVSQFNLYPAALKIKMVDVLRIFIQILEHHQSLAQKLNINYKLNLPDNLQEEYRLMSGNNNLPDHLTPVSSLSATTDPELLQTLLEKTFDIVTAIAYVNRESSPNHNNTEVEFEVSSFENEIKVSVKTKINPEPKEIIQQFLDINKGHLEMVDNLALSSSLESYIIKTITTLLNISFTTEYNQYSHHLSFNISINKYFKNPEH